MHAGVTGAIAAFLLLAACAASLDTFYQSGVQVAKLERDMLDCEVSALEAAPVAVQIRQPPSVFASSYYCTSPGFCFGGSWNSGIHSVDVNKDLRDRVTQQCMAKKGYAPVTIPRCPDAVAGRVPERATTVLPELTANSCVIRNADGTFQLVNRG